MVEDVSQPPIVVQAPALSSLMSSFLLHCFAALRKDLLVLVIHPTVLLDRGVAILVEKMTPQN
jgi:hypothetical protein